MNRTRLKLVAYVLACSCVGVCALALPWLCWSKPDVRNITTSWFEGHTESYASNWRNLDKFIRSIAKDGNVALRVTGSDPAQYKNPGMLLELYDRGSYTLYPQRLYAAERGTIVSNARDLITTKFDPPSEWFQQNNVRFIVQATSNSAGTIDFRVLPAPAGGGR